MNQRVRKVEIVVFNVLPVAPKKLEALHKQHDRGATARRVTLVESRRKVVRSSSIRSAGCQPRLSAAENSLFLPPVLPGISILRKSTTVMQRVHEMVGSII
jgi:hypothetical protein